MRNALAEAHVAPGEVGYINAHGSSTPLNDPTETGSIKQVFGEHGVPAAAQRHQGVLRPRPGRERGDRGGHLRAGQPARLAAAHGEPGDRPIRPATCPTSPARAATSRPTYLLSNSFGFGGINAALVFRRADA